MGAEPGRPIDDEMCQAVCRENLIRHRTAPARIKDVALEEEERDTRTPYCTK